MERIRSLVEKLHKALHSSKGKDMLLYLMCVCVAFVFWALLSLDSEVQRDYEVPVELTDVPDSVIVIGNIPSHMGVSVQGKGTQLLRYMWGRLPELKIKFSDNITEKNVFSLSKVKIDSRLRDYFGQGVQIMSVRPDSVRVTYTTAPGVSLPIIINADVHPSLQSIINGPITANVDSVKVYGINGVPLSLTQVETEKFSRASLRDTTRIEVAIKPVSGLRIIPDKVTITIPVEPLILKTRSVAVERIGMPDNTGMITFPSRVQVNYLVPLSEYHKDMPLRAFVEYSDINVLTQKVKVNLSALPPVCHNISVVPDSVEYIIERHLNL